VETEPLECPAGTVQHNFGPLPLPSFSRGNHVEKKCAAGTAEFGRKGNFIRRGSRRNETAFFAQFSSTELKNVV
jgi:hypothetical protein